MKFHNSLLSVDTDALSGKPYHICSHKVCVCLCGYRGGVTMVD